MTDVDIQRLLGSTVSRSPDAVDVSADGDVSYGI